MRALTGTAFVLAALVAGPTLADDRLATHMSVLGLVLEKSTFDDAIRVLGRTERRHNGGDAHGSATGACYSGADGTVLALVSHSEMGGDVRITHFELVARGELADFSGDPGYYVVPKQLRPRCARTAKVSRTTPMGGDVHLGMTRKQVRGLLGDPSRSGLKSLSYDSEEPVHDAPECATSRTLTVEFQRDRVIAVRADQITSC